MEYLTIVCPRCGRLHEVSADVLHKYKAIKCPISLRSYPTSNVKIIGKRFTL